MDPRLFCLFHYPEVVGYWIIRRGGPSYRLARYSRPRWLTRQLYRWLLDIDWQDA